MLRYNHNISKVFKDLDTCLERGSSIETFQTLLQQIDLDIISFDANPVFSNDGYTRTLLYDNPNLSVYKICWLSGQSSDIHGHLGSLCATYVIQGILTNRVFRLSNNYPLLEFEEELLAGAVTFLDRDGVHQSLNASLTPVISLHFYTPRLTGIKRFNVSS